jgi:hypothetical protein
LRIERWPLLRRRVTFAVVHLICSLPKWLIARAYVQGFDVGKAAISARESATYESGYSWVSKSEVIESVDDASSGQIARNALVCR